MKNALVSRRAAIGALAAAAYGRAQADTYPVKPIRVVVSTPPGGGSDLVMRPVAERLGRRLGQPMVIDNRAGAGGAIGADAVAKAAADGYTLLCATSSAVVLLPLTARSLPYDSQRDLVPIGQITQAPIVVTVRDSLAVHNLRELAAHARRHTGKLAFGSAGIGSAPHMLGELFASLAGVELTHVPYKGTALAAQDLIGGRIDVMFDNIGPTLQNLRGGRVRAIAVTGAQRARMLPDVPSAHEAGFPGLDAYSWVGLYAPQATPSSVIGKVHAELAHVLQAKELVEQLGKLGYDVVPRSPALLHEYVQQEQALWRKVIASRKLTFE
jgi:tripartite-type tricarboxylate transporter receptor subunit TctC